MSESNFESESWGPTGKLYARFEFSGVQISIFSSDQETRGVNVELITGADWRPDGEDLRHRTVLYFDKSRARSFASAVMGAASEK